MAIISNPAMVNSHGTFGNIVYVTRHGQTYIRTKPKNFHDKKSKKQLKRRAAITTANKPLKPLAPYAHFKYLKKGQTQRNALMKRIMKFALSYENNAWIINYDKILLSNSSLDPLRHLSATPTKNHTIQLNWEVNTGFHNTQPDDRLIVIFYNPQAKRNRVIEVSYKNILRSDIQCSHQTPKSWKGVTIYIYAYCINHNSSLISTSQCLKITAS